MIVTLCLIVKNEEDRLSECLKSFSGLYSDLVVVDTGSTDETKTVAKSFGAKVHNFEWIDDFAAARNFALSKVTTPWVMVVDADDIISAETKRVLQDDLAKLPSNTLGVFLPYIYSTANKQTAFTTYLPRIWKVASGYQYTLPIHEYLDIPKEDIKRFVRLPHPIIHHKTQEDFSKSIIRNLGILEKAIKTNPQQTRLLFYLGRENKSLGNYKQAIGWYSRFVKIPNVSKDELNRAYLGIGECYLKMNNTKSAKLAYQHAIRANPAFIEAYLQLGDIALQGNQYKKAVRFYLEATKKTPPQTHVFVNMQLYNGYAQKKLCEALAHIKEFSL